MPHIIRFKQHSISNTIPYYSPKCNFDFNLLNIQRIHHTMCHALTRRLVRRARFMSSHLTFSHPFLGTFIWKREEPGMTLAFIWCAQSLCEFGRFFVVLWQSRTLYVDLKKSTINIFTYKYIYVRLWMRHHLTADVVFVFDRRLVWSDFVGDTNISMVHFVEKLSGASNTQTKLFVILQSAVDIVALD